MSINRAISPRALRSNNGPLATRTTQLAITLSSLKHRNFRLLFCGTSLSHVGDFVQAMAQSWLVWQMTKSPFLLGLVGFAQALPRLLLGAVGGAIVDRVERRRLLLCTQFLAMAQAITFWVLVQFGWIEFWHVLALVLFLGTVNSLNQTARHSLINNIVPREDLMNAIALNLRWPIWPRSSDRPWAGC
jgi:MFS family permease